MDTIYNRLPIQVARYLNGNEYKVLDYLFYRNSLKGWKFKVKDIIIQTGISKSQVLRILKSFRNRNFLLQDPTRHYTLNYAEVSSWAVRCQNETKVRCQNDTKSGVKMRPVQEVNKKEVKTNSTSKLGLPSDIEIKKRIQERFGCLPSFSQRPEGSACQLPRPGGLDELIGWQKK